MIVRLCGRIVCATIAKVLVHSNMDITLAKTKLNGFVPQGEVHRVSNDLMASYHKAKCIELATKCMRSREVQYKMQGGPMQTAEPRRIAKRQHAGLALDHLVPLADQVVVDGDGDGKGGLASRPSPLRGRHRRNRITTATEHGTQRDPRLHPFPRNGECERRRRNGACRYIK